MKIEIDIADGLIPAGYEAVAFREPRNETALNATAELINGYTQCYPRLILRPIWQPPAWLKPGWIAMDGNSEWWWYANEPECRGERWMPINCNGRMLHREMLCWNPPPCTDWKSSLRRIGGGT